MTILTETYPVCRIIPLAREVAPSVEVMGSEAFSDPTNNAFIAASCYDDHSPFEVALPQALSLRNAGPNPFSYEVKVGFPRKLVPAILAACKFKLVWFRANDLIAYCTSEFNISETFVPRLPASIGFCHSLYYMGLFGDRVPWSWDALAQMTTAKPIYPIGVHPATNSPSGPIEHFTYALWANFLRTIKQFKRFFWDWDHSISIPTNTWKRAALSTW